MVAARSAICLVDGQAGRLYYRGWDATQLARGSSLERVAQLLWQCDERPFNDGNLPSMSTALRQAWQAASTLAPVDRCLLLLPAAGACRRRVCWDGAQGGSEGL